jgi:hypothetical protein
MIDLHSSRSSSVWNLEFGCWWVKSVRWTACWLAREAGQYIQPRMGEDVSDVMHGARPLAVIMSSFYISGRTGFDSRRPNCLQRFEFFLFFKEKKLSSYPRSQCAERLPHKRGFLILGAQNGRCGDMLNFNSPSLRVDFQLKSRLCILPRKQEDISDVMDGARVLAVEGSAGHVGGLGSIPSVRTII